MQLEILQVEFKLKVTLKFVLLSLNNSVKNITLIILDFIEVVFHNKVEVLFVVVH
jgi:hypothetical protein